ncbi:MAG TPA: phosphatidylglycerophosphatase A [Sedimentisphaerales bacterium]|nr:phosphatidylglycerophosphatase A [Sedimentisphaerales bacterium]
MYWRRLIAACFGLGWMPVAPGTWGSLPPAITFGLLVYCGAANAAILMVMGAMVVAGCVACVCCAPASIAAKGKQDPGEVVMDEFFGQALAFLAAPLLLARSLSGCESLAIAAIGFLAFRVFDILKPGPIRKLERFPAGWGILADDLGAGAVAAVCVCVAAVLMVRG